MSPDSTKRSTRSPTADRVLAPRDSARFRPRWPRIIAPPAHGPGPRPNARRHSQIFVLGLVATTLVGTLLLSLPWVTRVGQRTPLIDAFFTSVSSSSVAGLSVVDPLSHWNWWGQLILLTLVQIGGLGFTVGASILLQMLRRGAGAYTLRDELLLKDGSPALSVQEAVRLADRIVRFTIVAEASGALLLAAWFFAVGGQRPRDALWNGLFYAITAFCNAGFDLTRRFPASSSLIGDVWTNIILVALMQIGALSYIVFADVRRERNWRTLALDSKLVLGLNAVLLVGGALVFLATEWGGALAGVAPGTKLLASLFQSASARSAGFATVDWSHAHPLTLFFWLGLMFVGGASGSTAGGVRLSTVAVVLVAALSTVRGNPESQIWGRRIAPPIVFRAVTVIALFLLIFGTGTAVLAAAEQHLAHRSTGMIDLMFEAMSALATVGVSTGITPALSVLGKLTLCALMLIGRLGPLATVYALQRRQRPERFRFPEEAIRIG